MAHMEVEHIWINFGMITIEIRQDGSEVWLWRPGEDEGMQVDKEDFDEFLMRYYEAKF